MLRQHICNKLPNLLTRKGILHHGKAVSKVVLSIKQFLVKKYIPALEHPQHLFVSVTSSFITFSLTGPSFEKLGTYSEQYDHSIARTSEKQFPTKFLKHGKHTHS
jgi:hypothetical protein